MDMFSLVLGLVNVRSWRKQALFPRFNPSSQKKEKFFLPNHGGNISQWSDTSFENRSPHVAGMLAIKFTLKCGNSVRVNFGTVFSGL